MSEQDIPGSILWRGSARCSGGAPGCDGTMDLFDGESKFRELGITLPPDKVWACVCPRCRKKFCISCTKLLIGPSMRCPCGAELDLVTTQAIQKIAQEGLGKKKDDCFIATATTGSTTSWQVLTLRQFRDTILLQFRFGQQLVQWYYYWSPPIADHLRANPTQRRVVGWLISAISIVCLPIEWIMHIVSRKR